MLISVSSSSVSPVLVCQQSEATRVVILAPASAGIVLKFLAAAVEVDDHRGGDIFLVLQQDVPGSHEFRVYTV